MNCLFADDTAILTQSSNIKFIINSLQAQLLEIEKWCTQWRVAISTEKTKAILFRKGHCNKSMKQLTLFDEQLTWEPQVKYHGLILDNKLTFRQHTKYNSDKFWNKVHLIILLIGRRSCLSLRNKVLLFKQVLRPILTYAAQIWGFTAKSHRKKTQILQNKILRIMTNAPWFVRNEVIHDDLQIENIETHIKDLSRKFFNKIADHPNPLISEPYLSYSGLMWESFSPLPRTVITSTKIFPVHGSTSECHAFHRSLRLEIVPIDGTETPPTKFLLYNSRKIFA
ncbi:RNA-directed DNA polymerase from mobile element jockey [Araneus ventricosus]|uniref:RNA-directed DNA polymerase from mobile element jockey n=1 Tax=Araneus ventricosus TaxID=182803 RepID=A0A4Y2NEM2_ARAVE|nr:RNA-directed DNA polymerase from mobile element jockey [Araneus ventricosus]